MIADSLSGASELRSDGMTGPFQSFFSSEKISEIRSFFESVLREKTVHPLYRRFALRDWHLVFEPLQNLLTAAPLVENLVAATGADSLILWRTKLFEKFPGDGAVDWHQDYGYFDGEEIGGHRPALFPLGPCSPWTWTVWLALTDVGLDDGVMEMVIASNDTRYATRMVPLTKSGAFPYADPTNRTRSKAELIDRALANSLILDVQTDKALQGVDTSALSMSELLHLIGDYVDKNCAVVTEPFSAEEQKLRTFPMSTGQYMIFDQRTMHRSRAAGPQAKPRLAISARYTVGTTVVYPQRHMNSWVDGSGLDVRDHRCIRVHGRSFNEMNAYLEAGQPEFLSEVTRQNTIHE
jgi:non-heme Fe2+,alpha-ketoglutarate-dependent halogenase